MGISPTVHVRLRSHARPSVICTASGRDQYYEPIALRRYRPLRYVTRSGYGQNGIDGSVPSPRRTTALR
jgi:hypothetical protein